MVGIIHVPNGTRYRATRCNPGYSALPPRYGRP
jgi:hypothetical protein